LLRHPMAVSQLDDFAKGGFQRVIGDDTPKSSKTKRVLICSGKVYYDLVEERKARNAQDDVAIVRIEQIYPLAEEHVTEILGAYKKAELVWVQEEPENMGAAFFLLPRIGSLGFKIGSVARKAAASPATGNKDSHDLEQQLLIKAAFGDKVE